MSNRGSWTSLDTIQRAARGLAVALALKAGAAHAATLTVNSTGDNTTADAKLTLREAVLLVNNAGDADAALSRSLNAGESAQISGAFGSADTIRFDKSLTAAGDATVYLHTTGSSEFGYSALALESDVTLSGPTGNAGITIAGLGADTDLRLFFVPDGVSVTMTGLTLRGGRCVGGDGEGLRAGGGGGAGLGGAIFNAGSLTLENCTLTGNTALGGHGGDGTNNGILGSAGGAGGGLGGGSGGGPRCYAGTIGYTGDFGGGGSGGHDGGSAGTFGGYGGFGGGGGGFAHGIVGPAKGGFGGGNGSGWPAVSTPFGGAGGGGAGMGGALFNNGGTLSLTNCTISGNTAQGGEGGTQPAYNSAQPGQGLGGGIFNRDGTLTLTNVTLSNNQALDYAGAPIAAGGRGVFNLGDDDHSGGDTALYGTATAVITNSILGQSDTDTEDFTSTAVNSGDCSTSGSGNLIRTYSGFYGSVDSTADPLLGALADNGGPTYTHEPLPGSSPAIDALSSGPANDQRGAPRAQGAAFDLGAVEVVQTDANDPDGDGLTNDVDPDDDGDGVPDAKDPDRDGDGVDNALDPAPDDASDAGAFGQVGVPGLSVKALALKLDFANAGKDGLKATGVFPVPGDFVTDTATVDVDAGGQTQSFTLDEKGKGVTGTDSFTLKVGKNLNADGTRTAKWTLALKNGSFAVNDAKGDPFDGSSPGIADRVLKLTLSVEGADPDLRYNVGTVVYKSTDLKGSAKSKKP